MRRRTMALKTRMYTPARTAGIPGSRIFRIVQPWSRMLECRWSAPTRTPPPPLTCLVPLTRTWFRRLPMEAPPGRRSKVLVPYQCGSQTCTLGTVIYDLVVVPQAQASGSLPAVTSVVNAAGFQPGIVANSWVTIQGTQSGAADRRLEPFDCQRSVAHLTRRGDRNHGRQASIRLLHLAGSAQRACARRFRRVGDRYGDVAGRRREFLDHREPLRSGILPVAGQPGGGDATRL